MTTRDGSSVPAHFGSAAAELAICARGVGLAARSDLCSLEVGAPADALTRLSERVADHALAPGGVAQVGTVWRCRTPGGDAIHAICRRLTAPRVIRTLRVWQTLMEAGRSVGICCIGVDAVDRHRLRERARIRGLELL